MIVRGWLMTGASIVGNGLPSEAYVGHYRGELPRAENFKVGQWPLWQLVSLSPQMTLVCIEVPL